MAFVIEVYRKAVYLQNKENAERKKIIEKGKLQLKLLKIAKNN